jgi:4-hydroxymandelate oxidase
MNVTVEDFEEQARERLPQLVYDYYAGGAGDEWTLRENRRAFERWVFRPRFLVDCSNVDLRTTVLGQEIDFPVMVAPTAFHRLADPDGELATARGTAKAGTVMVLSTISTASIEDVGSVGGPKWFQLYVHRDRELTADLVERARVSGYSAIVMTVDAPLLGRRLRDERNSFTLPEGIGLANLEGIPLPAEPGSNLFRYFASQLDPAITWEDVRWLRELSPLPVVLKGILTAEDAKLAVDVGVEGIVVSNHGGRQLDGAPATMDVLPEVVEAVDGQAEVYLDGGVRRGTDALKALALGARAVMVGRPVLWGLAANGQAGVAEVLTMLKAELGLAMTLTGRGKVEDVDRSLVAPASGPAT